MVYNENFLKYYIIQYLLLVNYIFKYDCLMYKKVFGGGFVVFGLK